MSVEELLRLLIEQPLEDFDHGYPILMAYEYHPGEVVRIGTQHVFSALLDEVANQKDLRHKLQLLPANQFVWSDELANAIELVKFYDLSHEKHSSEIELKWDVAPGPYRKLLEDCPDFPSAGGGKQSRQSQRKRETAARHASWRKFLDQAAKEYPNHSHSRLCQIVAQRISGKAAHGAVDPESIRRVTRKTRK